MNSTDEEMVTIRLPKRLCLQLSELLEAGAASGIMDCVWLLADFFKRAAANKETNLQPITDDHRSASEDDEIGEWTRRCSDLTASLTAMLDRLYPRKP
jgi:hypothetical protein